MKKLMLFVLALSAAVSAVRADAPFTYGICTDNVVTYGTGKAGTNYSAAIEVPQAVARQLQGGKVTAVSYTFGAGSNKNVEIFLTYDLDAEPFYTQTTARQANSVNEVTLDTPYEIDGRAFYIGYNYRQTTSSGKPVIVDGRNLGGMDVFSHLAVWADKEQRNWADCSAEGALAIRATIEGARIGSNAVLPVALDLPRSAGTYKNFEYGVTFLNLADADASVLRLSTQIGSGEEVEETLTLDRPLAAGQTYTRRFEATTAGPSEDFRVSVAVTAVDGNDNLYADAGVNAPLLVSDYLFPRVVVIEEYTGVDCGWCPAGYVAMEQMRQNHPDDYIGIAVHNYSGDPMRCEAYSSWLTTYSGGAPHATVNRDRALGDNGVFNPQPATCEAVYQQSAGMVNLCLELGVDFAEGSQTELDVRVSTYFDYDIDGQDYGFAIVQTEDNVGPYWQSNGYAGGSRGEMFGFEKEGTRVELVYNDVARAIEGWNGSAALVPQGLKRGERFAFEKRVALGQPGVQKTADTHVVVLLIDRADGHIITANHCRIGEEKSSAPAIAARPEAAVRAVAGGIEINGSYDCAEVYGIDGRRVAAVRGESRIDLPRGLYIVRVDGRSVKVNVKC